MRQDEVLIAAARRRLVGRPGDEDLPIRLDRDSRRVGVANVPRAAQDLGGHDAAGAEGRIVRAVRVVARDAEKIVGAVVAPPTATIW